ncbi:DUF726-domain-containing protein [Hymenopellis radicata]|nr:DUF726-domain-containing protein [Hymenopellis radicata]
MLAQITPPKELTQTQRDTVFQHFFCRLASFRNTAILLSDIEFNLSSSPEQQKTKTKEQFGEALNRWAQQLLQHAWLVCNQPEEDECPELDPFADTSTGHLPQLPPEHVLTRILNAILFLDITTAKQYSAHTRVFLQSLGPLNEDIIVSTLKHPDDAVKEAQQQAESTTKDHATRGKTLRMVGIGLSAVAGGVLVGVTGGLAAPLVGAGVTTVLGWLGIGGTVAGLLASGLAGSSVVCGALFGAYGATSTGNMVRRHTREIRDLALVPVGDQAEDGTLAVRLCVSGWLASQADVTNPWMIFGEDDTVALQWEVQALTELSDALYTLVKTQTMTYIKAELDELVSPIAWLKIGQIIDNPWSNSRALALKAGAVLGDLLAKRVFGTRPVTLTGYSLGSLVIMEALKYLASLPPSDTLGLIQHVFVYGTPISTDEETWAGVRRLVAGRLVNGYSSNDYVLAVLSRASNVTWKVAGLEPVSVKDVENVHCDFVDGHTMWRGLIGRSLQVVNAPGVMDAKVDSQIKADAERLRQDIEIQETSHEKDDMLTGEVVQPI